MKKIVLACFVALSQLLNAQVFEVVPIEVSGPIDDRINIVILSEGFEDIPISLDQFFILSAQSFAYDLFEESPFKEYKNYFNVYAIKVPSNETGVSHPGTATDVAEPAHPVSNVDNYFESSFDGYGIHRIVVANNSKIQSVLASNFPNYDIALVLAFSNYYGARGGGDYAIFTTNAGNDVAIHEIGHSFSYLRDEYYAGDNFAGESINMTQETDPDLVKWSSWMNQNDIGIYQHCCGGNSANWYRPSQNCKMRASSNSFCSVCIEATIERIYSLVPSIESYSPENTGTLGISDTINFTISTIDPIPNTLQIEWTLNGSVIESGTHSVEINQDDLIAGNNQLQVTVEDTTDLLKTDSEDDIHLSTVLWNIDPSTLSIDEISTEDFKINIFPNPTQDVLHFNVIREINNDYDVIISDTSGKELINKRINDTNKSSQIPLGTLASGVYFINFKFENGLEISKKIIKK